MPPVLNVWRWEWWFQTCVSYIWWCRRWVQWLSTTTSPAAPICPDATISGERPAALVSPATDLIGGRAWVTAGGEVDSFWYRRLLLVVRRKLNMCTVDDPKVDCREHFKDWQLLPWKCVISALSISKSFTSVDITEYWDTKLWFKMATPYKN